MDILEIKSMGIEATEINKTQEPLPAPNLRKTIQKNQEPKNTNHSVSGMTKKDVEEIVESLNDLPETLQTSLNYSVHEENKQIIVKVIDKETEEIIKQIPPEEIVELQDKMRELTGRLLDVNV
ncbi:MAG: flagellar protein FlaG [Desulfobacteraceae bacterium]|nr:flagellar protein FlaG [Desulfobacteraceae bacterium]